MKTEIQKQLKVDQGSIRLDKFLQAAFPNISRVELQNTIAAGDVLVDGVVVKDKSKLVKRNQRVDFSYYPPALTPNFSVKLKKLYEDDDVLVLDKPAGVLVHPNTKTKQASIAASLLAEIKAIHSVGENSFRPGIVHRLDADTSGVLLVAKNQNAYLHLKHEFQSRKVYKEYLALVHGELKDSHGRIDAPIGRRAGQGKLSTGIGRPALTEYWLEKKFGNPHTKHEKFTSVIGSIPDSSSGVGVDTYSLLKVQLHTGRTHQIRVHFSYLGHSVVGDKLYGGKWKKVDSKKFPRQFLHAHKLRIKLPSGMEKEFISPLPPDLKNILAILKRNPSFA